jgi:hypothetical protein
MDTSNSPKDDMDNTLPEWHEPFPEPQTIPSGWDLSGILSDAATTSILEAEPNAED